MILPIIQAPHPLLNATAARVDVLDLPMRKLAGDLLDTMRKHKAAGLAAPQVGVLVRMIAINQRTGCPFSIMVNPEIIGRSPIMVPGDEGCMSIEMGQRLFPKARHAEIRVRFCDRAVVRHEITLKGFAARIVQHEVDHLDGKMVGP